MGCMLVFFQLINEFLLPLSVHQEISISSHARDLPVGERSALLLLRGPRVAVCFARSPISGAKLPQKSQKLRVRRADAFEPAVAQRR